MSSDKSLEQQFLEFELPKEVLDYLTRLKCLNESQEKELNSIRQKNERLEQKLKNIQAYNEELQEQIKTISGKVSQKSTPDSTSKRKETENGNGEKTKRVDADDEAKNDENINWSFKREENGDVDHVAIVDQIKNVASEVARDQFLKDMVYEPSSGLYFDYKSGYYFDADRSLYYDGNSGTYYSYNYETKSYEVHSQVEMKAEKKTKKRTNDENKELKYSKKCKKKKQDEETPEERKKSISDSEDSSKFKSSNNSNTNFPKEKSDGDKLDSVSSCSEPEDGEISTSDFESSDEDDADEAEGNVGTVSSLNLPTSCIRIVVTESSDDSLAVGKLFIVTCTGGTIGREGDHDVLLSEEVGCSKVHARISHNENRYVITDLGSSNGTFVNGSRLSNPKTESESREIGHGSVLQIGTTKLLCHVHPGRETCFECEPGLVQVKEVPKNVGSMSSKASRENTRKKEMREIRKKYGLSSSGVAHEPKTEANYSDRAGDRRRQVGSDNPFEKTESSHLEKSIDSKNKGFKMLQKMGWSEGKGLGKESKGRIEPVPVATKNDRSGLGDSMPKVEIDFRSKKKSELWKRTQARFKNTEVSTVFDPESEDENEGKTE